MSQFTSTPILQTLSTQKKKKLLWFLSIGLDICRCPCSPGLSVECLIKWISRLCGHFDKEVTEDDFRVIALDVKCGSEAHSHQCVCVIFKAPGIVGNVSIALIYPWRVDPSWMFIGVKQQSHWFSLNPLRGWHERWSQALQCEAFTWPVLGSHTSQAPHGSCALWTIPPALHLPLCLFILAHVCLHLHSRATFRAAQLAELDWIIHALPVLVIGCLCTQSDVRPFCDWFMLE